MGSVRHRSGDISANSGDETHYRDCNTEVELNTGEVQVSGQTGYLRIACNIRHTGG